MQNSASAITLSLLCRSFAIGRTGFVIAGADNYSCDETDYQNYCNSFHVKKIKLNTKVKYSVEKQSLCHIIIFQGNFCMLCTVNNKWATDLLSSFKTLNRATKLLFTELFVFCFVNNFTTCYIRS
jgi:hypothetical protein